MVLLRMLQAPDIAMAGSAAPQVMKKSAMAGGNASHEDVTNFQSVLHGMRASEKPVPTAVPKQIAMRRSSTADAITDSLDSPALSVQNMPSAASPDTASLTENEAVAELKGAQGTGASDDGKAAAADAASKSAPQSVSPGAPDVALKKDERNASPQVKGKSINTKHPSVVQASGNTATTVMMPAHVLPTAAQAQAAAVIVAQSSTAPLQLSDASAKQGPSGAVARAEKKILPDLSQRENVVTPSVPEIPADASSPTSASAQSVSSVSSQGDDANPGEDGKKAVSVGSMTTTHGAATESGLHNVTAQLSPMEPGVSFRSSFLNEAPRIPTAKAASEEAVHVGVQEGAMAAVEPAVRHLEVKMTDAGMGQISVRAEMRDGVLHASVSGIHADSLLTATALHQFLEQNQVTVHGLHVDTASPFGARQSVASLSDAGFSSAEGDQSNASRHGGGQEQRGRSHWNSQSERAESAAERRTEEPSSLRVPVALSPAEGNRLSIRI